MPKPAYPLCGQRAFLETLAPYLPYGIDIFHPATGRTGWLRGLPATYEGQELPLADVEFYADAEAKAEGGGDLLECASKILPVLYSFEDLCTPLADGTIPAVLVAKQWHPNIKRAEIVENYDGYGITCVASGAGIELSISKQGFDDGTLGDWLAKLLRGQHFAVGLAPTQYKRKEVAGKVHNCELEGCAHLMDVAGPCEGCAGKEACRYA